MKLPDELFGQKVNGAYEKYLARAKKPVEVKKSKVITPVNIDNPESYLILEGRAHGNYSYPDLLVSIEKYHHNKTWYKTQEDLQKENAFMLTIRQFVDFINLLKSGKAFNGAGKKVNKIALDKMLDDIITVRSPGRAEWLDNYFEQRDNGFYVLTDNRTKPLLLDDCLMKNKLPGIDLDSWLKSANEQGLPTEKTTEGSMYYWNPKNGKVAGFYAGSDWAGLVCGGDPGGAGSALGVRVAREK